MEKVERFVYFYKHLENLIDIFLFVVQGLGKGGAKRHRKILRDNIQGGFFTFHSSSVILLLTPAY